VTELSGGERSRVALARVLRWKRRCCWRMNRRASLDPRYQIEVMKNLRRCRDGGMLGRGHPVSLGCRAFRRYGSGAVGGSFGRPWRADRSALTHHGRRVRISAYRARVEQEDLIVPWAEI